MKIKTIRSLTFYLREIDMPNQETQTVRDYYRNDFGFKKFQVEPGITLDYDDLMDSIVEEADSPFDQEAKEDEQHFRDWLRDLLV